MEVERICQQTPGLILAEGCRFDEPAVLSMSEEYRLLHASIWGIQRSLVAWQRTLGLNIVLQRDFLSLPHGRTRNVDITIDQWMDMLRAQAFDFSTLKPSLSYKARYEQWTAAYAPVIREPYRRHLAQEFENEYLQASVAVDAHKPVTDLVEQTREQNVIQAILSESQDVIVPWGTNHIRPLSEALCQCGNWEVDVETLRYLTHYRLQFHHITDDADLPCNQ